MRTSIIAFTLTTVLVAAPLHAQVPADPSDPITPTGEPMAEMPTAPVAPIDAEPPEPAPTAPTVVIAELDTASSMARATDTLSVDFPDEEIRNILRNVADLFELNLVIPDTLQGNTSIKLRDVTWRQIFEVVLAPVGYTFVEEGNIIKIVSQESLLQEPVTTDVFIINYALAEDIRGSVEPLIEAAVGGRIVVNTRSNALIITERPSRLSKIRPIIEALDKATDQVMIESKFIEVTDRNVKNIGVNWASLSGYELGVGSINRAYDSTSGNSYNNDRTNEIINGSGRLGERLSEDERINGRTNSSDTGLTSTVSNNNGATTSESESSLASSIANSIEDTLTVTDTITDTSEVSNTLTQLNNLIGLGGTTRTDSAVFSASQFNLILSALQTQNDSKLVSNPTVVTLNNTEAQINVGSEFPIPNYTYNAERGTFEVSGFEYRPIGIILRVTPQVNAQGFIKLQVAPEVSSQNGFTSFGGAGGAEIPIIATRRAVTQVSLRDGYTMGIGGLVETDSLVGNTKVPVLGSIPGLGRLFRSDSKNETKRNLLIFITAKTVSADGAPPEVLFDPRQIKSMNLQRSDLPGYREPGADPFLPETTPSTTR